MSKDNPRAWRKNAASSTSPLLVRKENCVLTHAEAVIAMAEYDVFAQSFLERYRSQIYLYVGRCRYYQRFIGYSSFLGFPATEGNGRRGLCLSGRSGSRTAGSSDTDGNGFLSSTPSSSSAPALSGLHVGAKVRHDRFGEGEVTAIEGEGPGQWLNINHSLQVAYRGFPFIVVQSYILK